MEEVDTISMDQLNKLSVDVLERLASSLHLQVQGMSILQLAVKNVVVYPL